MQVNEGHAQGHKTFNDIQLSVKTILASTVVQLSQTPQPKITSSRSKAKGMQFLRMLEDKFQVILDAWVGQRCS